MRMHSPPHPGEVLKDALQGLAMTVTEFAAHIGVSRGNLSRLLNGRSGVTPEMSIRISAAFGQSPDLWFKLQNAYDFYCAKQVSKSRVRRIEGVQRRAA